MAIYTRTPVNEVYFGDESFKEMQTLLGEIRRKHIKKSKDMMSKNINKDGDLNRLNKMFANKFGFKTFALHIINLKIMNAFTRPVSRNKDIDMSKHVISDKNGFKFDKKAKFDCMICIYSGIFLNEDFSDREVMAVILHEIGHSFQLALDDNVNCLTDIEECFEIAKFFTNDLFISQLGNDKLSSNLSNKPTIVNRVKDMFKIFGYVGIELAIDVLNVTVIPLKIIDQFLGKIIDTIVFTLFPKSKPQTTKYKKEQIADNFVTMYGYAPELTTALAKFEFETTSESRKSYNKVPLIPQFMQLTMLGPSILCEVFNIHPVFTDRVVDQINLLEYELKKTDMDPEMKESIQSDINRVKIARDDYLKAKLNIQDPHMYRKAYFNLLYAIGGSPRYRIETDNEKTFTNIDAVYDSNKK